MKALILNSGRGARMGTFTESRHKSMARLGNGETIFGRQLRLLASVGITEVVVTTGPHADQLAAVAAQPHLSGLSMTWVPTDRYQETNYIYSMYLAREHLESELILLHGDLVFNGGVLAAFLADERPDLGTVNATLPQPEKDFKARVIGQEIREISVSIRDDDCVAFQPMYKLSARAVRAWVDRIVQFVERGDAGVYAETALNEVATEVGIHAFSYVDHLVSEVDTLDDLARVTQAVRLFDFAEQPVLSAVDSRAVIVQLMADAGVHRPLVVAGHAFDASPIKPNLDGQGIEYVRFAGYSPNPKWGEVRAGLAVFRENGCDGVISVGGGSAIDVAKCIKLLAASDSDEVSEFGAPLPRFVPHVCVPTTAGTGSESTNFAVVYVNGEKRSIAHDALLPEWVILDSALLETLPKYHKKAALLDALCQCIESSWSKSATEQSLGYAMAGIRLILDNLAAYISSDGFDVAAARRILVASNLGGKAINLTKTTAPHAMSYKLTSLYGIAHGHAVALCLVEVWRHFNQLVAVRAERGLAVAPALDRLAQAFGAPSRESALARFESILGSLELTRPSPGADDEMDELVGSVNQERLGNSPVPLAPADVRGIYEQILK